MATEDEVIAHIRSYNDVTDLGDGMFTVNWPLDDGRSQIVILTVSDTFVALVSPFAEKDAISAERAVSLAKVFGVCDMNGRFYGLRNILLIEDLGDNTVSGLVKMAHVIAVRADAIESEVGGDRF
jgi:hypothetical protein